MRTIRINMGVRFAQPVVHRRGVRITSAESPCRCVCFGAKWGNEASTSHGQVSQNAFLFSSLPPALPRTPSQAMTSPMLFAPTGLRELSDGTLQQVLTHWRSAIQQGNEHYQRMAPGSLAQALSLFQDALLMADVLFEQWPDADVAMAAYVVSHHNLADTLLRLDETDDAATHLCVAHERLERLRDDSTQPVLRRNAAGRHLSRTLAELERFAQHHGSLLLARCMSEHLLAQQVPSGALH